MRQSFGWLFLVFSLALLMPGISTAQDEQGGNDPLVKMMEEGWRPVAPGVLQRQHDQNKVETFAVGPEGMRFIIKQLQGRLSSLVKDYQSQPSEELRRGIANYRRQIARFRREMRAAKAESLESALEKVGCSVSYSSYANATWLTNVAGVTSSSSANFNNTCGYPTEVFAEARAYASKNGVFDDFLQQDGPRFGAAISASATATIEGTTNCSSSAYSYARYSGANIFLSFSASNPDQCPPPAAPPLSASMTGPSFASFQYATSACSTKTWTASASGGTPSYSYQWKYNGTVVGTGTSYSRTVCPSSADFTITLTVTDSGIPSQQVVVNRAVTIAILGGTSGCSTSDKALPTEPCR